MSIATCMNCRKSYIGVCKVHNEDVNYDTVDCIIDYVMDSLPIRGREYEDRQVYKWVNRCNHMSEEDHDG